MEKKGDLLNQLALIVDLIEKINLNDGEKTMTITVNETEFKELFDYFQNKNGKKMKLLSDTFSIYIETVEIIFNKSNV